MCMCDIPFDRSIRQLSNSIRHVMPSTDRKLELTAQASMAQPVSQPAVYANGLIYLTLYYPVRDQVVWHFTVLCHLFSGLYKHLAPGPLYCSLLGILLFPFFLDVVCS
jgi:hypothetical protein